MKLNLTSTLLFTVSFSFAACGGPAANSGEEGSSAAAGETVSLPPLPTPTVPQLPIEGGATPSPEDESTLPLTGRDVWITGDGSDPSVAKAVAALRDGYHHLGFREHLFLTSGLQTPAGAYAAMQASLELVAIQYLNAKGRTLEAAAFHYVDHGHRTDHTAGCGPAYTTLPQLNDANASEVPQDAVGRLFGGIFNHDLGTLKPFASTRFIGVFDACYQGVALTKFPAGVIGAGGNDNGYVYSSTALLDQCMTCLPNPPTTVYAWVGLYSRAFGGSLNAAAGALDTAFDGAHQDAVTSLEQAKALQTPVDGPLGRGW
jgi:hypothetical protein